MEGLSPPPPDSIFFTCFVHISKLPHSSIDLSFHMPPMSTIPSSFYYTLLILLGHIGCFSCSENRLLRRGHGRRPSSKNKINNIVSFITRLFSFSSSSDPANRRATSATSRCIYLNPPQEDDNSSSSNHHQRLFPCTACGEIFQKPSLLERHVSSSHGVSVLIDGENIVRIIFKAGWPEKARSPKIHRILKIHHNTKTVARFEEHREQVKSRSDAGTPRDERCAADGNELLRFCYTTFVCGLQSGICDQQYCGACGIVRSGFSRKVDGISTFPTSWMAHAAVPEDEFRFMNVKRAMLLCRVVAGRVGCYSGHVEKEDTVFDSLVSERNGLVGLEDELLVLHPRAVLPCFLIVYTL